MYKTIVRIMTATILMVFCFALAFGNGQGDAGESGEGVYTIKFSSNAPAGLVATESMKMFATNVSERTGGKLIVEVFTDGQLGNERDVMEAVRVGAIEMAHLSLGSLAIIDEDLNVFSLPYIWRDEEHLLNAVRGEVGKSAFEEFRKKSGAKILDAGWIWGIRHLTSKGIKVETPSDLAGQKIRAPEIPIYVDMVKSWGALPVAVQSNDIYMALQTGLAKGQENPITAIYTWKLNEVQDYLMLTAHMIQVNPIIINDAFYNKLPAEYQKILMEEIIAAGDYNNKTINSSDLDCLEKMKREGLNVVQVNKESFMEATRSIHEKYISEESKSLYDAILKL